MPKIISGEAIWKLTNCTAKECKRCWIAETVTKPRDDAVKETTTQRAFDLCAEDGRKRNCPVNYIKENVESRMGN